MPLESMSPHERGWFLGQIDEIFADDYDKDQYEALQEVCNNGDAHILYLEDKTRRAVVKFAGEYIDQTIEEAKKLELKQTPTSLARVVATMCCLIGIAAGMNYVMAEDEEEEDEEEEEE